MSEDVVTLGLGVDSRQVKEAKASLDQLATSGGLAEQTTNNLTTASDKLAGVVRMLASAYATLKVTQYTQEAVVLSQRYQQMGIVMGVVAANTGQSKAAFETTSQALQKLGISMLESRNTVIKLATANIDLANAEKLADLARNAAIVGNMNTSQALDTLVHGIQSAQVEVLRTIGINVNFERSYADLAKQLGVNSNKLTEAQKQQARMNVVLAEAVNFNGLYEASLANAGKMMKSTERLSENLKIKVGAIFDDSAMLAVSAYSNQLLDLNKNADRLAANGAIKDWSRQIAVELAFLMDMGRNLFGIFGALGGLLFSQAENIKNLDFGKMTETFADADKELKAVLGDTSKYQDMVESRIVQEDMLTDKITGQNNNLKKRPEIIKTNLELEDEANRKRKKAQDDALAREHEYVKLLEIESKHRQELIEPYETSAKQAVERLESMRDEISSLLIVKDRQIDLQQAIQLTAIARLEDKKASQADPGIIDQINNEIAARKKIEELIPIQRKLELETKNTTDQVSQLWMQAGRNIQSTLANSIFNFFDDGLKGMLKNVVSTIGRIAAEFAALKIAQGIGLAGMFGMSGAANASSGGGGLLNIASMGSGAMSMFKGGFGINSLLSSAGGMLPGSAGSFFSGMGGGAIPGVSSQAALMGSSFASVAGPAIALFAADALTKAFAGDKSVSNNGVWKAVSDIPIIGVLPNLINGLFGHGPMKFRQQSLQGDISSTGFNGDFTNVFKSKGALFTSNKHKSVTEQLSQDQQDLFDQTIKGFYTSSHKFAENLGLSADLVDTFTKTVQIKSEKGKNLTEEAITEMIQGIGDSLAKNVLPNIDDFRKAGEKSFDTFTRLNNEFSALSDAALMLGKSVAESRAFIAGATFEGRSAFIEAAGGIDALNQKVAMFTQNFLTESERLAPAQENLNEQLTKLGLSTSLSKGQFKDLVQSFGKVNGISEETLQALLNLQGGFLLVRNGTESMLSDLRATAKARIESAKADKIASAESAFSALQRSVDAERTRITDEYNAAVKISDERIKSVTESVNNLTQFSNTLKSTIDSISPMSLLSARAIASSAIQTGNIDPSSLSNVVSILGGSLDSSKFKDRNALMRGQGQNAGLLSGLSSETDAQLLLAQRSLDALEASRQLLDDGFKNQMIGLDNILANAQSQLDALKGIDNSVMSLANAIMQMNAASQGGGGGSGGSGFVGNSDVTASDIQSFFDTPHTAAEIATAAAAHNLSSGEIADAAGFSQATVDEFFASNPNIPHFGKGTSSVPRTGPAFVHAKERIINPEQNADIVDSLKSLVDMVAAGTIASNDLYRLLRDSMQETSTGLAITTKAAA